MNVKNEGLIPLPHDPGPWTSLPQLTQFLKHPVGITCELACFLPHAQPITASYILSITVHTLGKVPNMGNVCNEAMGD